MVDIWFLFCIFSTFAIIVFHVLIDLLIPGPSYGTAEYFQASQQTKTTKVSPCKQFSFENLTKTEPNDSKARKLEKFGRIFIAVVFIIFNGTYWLIIYTK